MSLPWSTQQREWLQALGHPALVLVADHAADPDATANPSVNPSTNPSVASCVRPPPVLATPPPSSPIAPRPTDDKLHRALLRATGQHGAGAEQVLRGLAVDPAGLRGDPAAKRALWQRLRSLRGKRSR